jgi:hypothetical protein
MRIKKSATVSMIALAVVCLGASPVLAGETHGAKIRWDIIQIVQNGTTFTALPGGISKSAASFQPALFSGDDSTITLTGNGTFQVGESHHVTGGGTWTTAMKDGTVTGSGTYQVTELEYFQAAPGSLAAAGIVDGFGNTNDAEAGIAAMKVSYSDGEKGILVVVCALAGTPLNVIEGTTATKGIVDYADPHGTDASIGNTLFHVIHEESE